MPTSARGDAEPCTSRNRKRAQLRGLSEKRCKQRLSCQYFSALGIRSPKVIANAFRAGLQRMVDRVWPVPLGSSDLVHRG